MKSLPKPAFVTLLLVTFITGISTASTSTNASAPSTVWSAPDNDVGQKSNSKDLTSNTSGKDEVLTIKVGGSPKDEVFTVEIVNTETGKILDTVPFSEGNAPPVTLPSGSTARVRDDADSNSQKPRGTWSKS